MLKDFNKIKSEVLFRAMKLILIMSLIVLSYIWGIFTIHKKIFPYEIISSIGQSKKDLKADAMSKTGYDLDKFWAKKITEGGYILHFRHGHREKWSDVTAFDAYEIFTKTDAESSTFANATCLSPRGKEEAKLIGNVFRINSITIGKVISSPSCRALQTARYAFGKIDLVDTSLLHRSAMMKEQQEHFAHQLRKLLLENSPTNGENTILTGHGTTLERDYKILFENNLSGGLRRKETGFIVIENVEGKLYTRHRFESIQNYVNASLMLPLN
jgi:phosphohistidine phosphatase SixA